jgi:hypothetical protein
MRLSEIRNRLLSERQIHSPTLKYTDKQSPWRGSIGDNKSFGGVNAAKLRKAK